MRVTIDLFAQNEWANVERLRGAVERCFLAAIERAREQGSRVFELRAALALGALDLRSPEAEAALAAVRERLAGKLDDPSLADL